MRRLADQSPDVLREREALRARREQLLREADRHRYRLHRLGDLTRELRLVTEKLLKLELEAGRQRAPRFAPEPAPELSLNPLGDAGAVGGTRPARLPYKD